MADGIGPARLSTRRPGRPSWLGCPPSWASYQVTVYLDKGDERCRVHTEQCRDEAQARNFAYNYLLATYTEVGIPTPGWERLLVWCELEPGRWVGGQWQPDPRAEQEVDRFTLNPQSGEITIEPWASLWRWPPGGAR